MPYSTYSRIRELLSRIANQQPTDIFDLSKSIHDEAVESFAIWRRGSDGVSIKQYCSPTAIRRLIRFTEELELLSIDNDKKVNLTSNGQNALHGNNFDSQLTTQIKEYLERHGTSFARIIGTLKSIKPPDFSDRYTIFERLRSSGMTIDDDDFRRVINLLVRTGEIDSRIRRLFIEVRR